VLKSNRYAKAIEAAALAAEQLYIKLTELEGATVGQPPATPSHEALLESGGKAFTALDKTLKAIAPHKYGSVGITLGRTDGIAKFFAFSFVAQEKKPLAQITAQPFWGSGVYAIYYHGKTEAAYKPISATETPIYVGKADPSDAFAESIESQGKSLYNRLKEHARNIEKSNLSLKDFHYRAATIQSGMQAAVEEFMLSLFGPIWNKGVGPCHGLGKHGDSATTRANKRSPWDTMHPGRKWAIPTLGNQAEKHEIESMISSHFDKNAVIKDKADLLSKLMLT
jgi:hypothetical protein